jgi:hypothetical protein
MSINYPKILFITLGMYVIFFIGNVVLLIYTVTTGLIVSISGFLIPLSIAIFFLFSIISIFIKSRWIWIYNLAFNILICAILSFNIIQNLIKIKTNTMFEAIGFLILIGLFTINILILLKSVKVKKYFNIKSTSHNSA